MRSFPAARLWAAASLGLLVLAGCDNTDLASSLNAAEARSGSNAVVTLRVNPNNVVLKPGDSLRANVRLTDPVSGTDRDGIVSWSSADTSVVQVSELGVLAAVGVGHADVVAHANTGPSDTVHVSVKSSVAPLEVSPDQASVAVGQTTQLSATAHTNGHLSTDPAVKWASTEGTVASVSADGLVRGLKPGRASIVATTDGGTSASVAVSVTEPAAPPAVASVGVSPATATLTVGGTSQLAAVAYDASKNPIGGQTISWTTSAQTVATVSSAGIVTAVGSGTATITATAGGQSGSAQITVSAPTTPPPSTSNGALPAPAMQLLGHMLPASQIAAQGGVYQRYVDDFMKYSEQHWTLDGSGWLNANYYDRAKIYYAWYAMTGTPAYLDRATALVLDYRTNYLEANNWSPSPFWAMMEGVALHYLITGDQKSLYAIGQAADGFALDNYMRNMGSLSSEWMDNRGQGRALSTFLYAYLLRAPSIGNVAAGDHGGRDWAQVLRVALDTILKTQASDGAYRFQSATTQCGYNKPFMVGILNDALIEYYELFEHDPRILPAVKKSLDYMWAKDWDSGKQAFAYLDGPCTGHDGPAAPDLNNLISSGFGWVYRTTGDATYRTRGDQVFAGGVQGAWLSGTKQFNQEYTTSYRYLGMR